ncbi:hypothetical protein CLOM_g5105 [Closterium sp. NIES-68]|nr:hypothetical protein CLOM_g5105 [Closterium sp. NIES-68]
MGAWISSFIFVGIAVQLACLKLGWTPWRGTDLDDEALFLLINQSVRTATGLGIVWFVARPYQPLPSDLFHFGFEDPFSCRKGWLSWAGVGVLAAGLVVFATASATTALSGGIDAPREDASAPGSSGQCLCICCGAYDTQRISKACSSWLGIGLHVCSHAQPPLSNNHSFCVELRSYHHPHLVTDGGV